MVVRIKDYFVNFVTPLNPILSRFTLLFHPTLEHVLEVCCLLVTGPHFLEGSTTKKSVSFKIKPCSTKPKIKERVHSITLV